MPPKTITKSKKTPNLTTPTDTIVDTPLQDPFKNTVIISSNLSNLDGAPVAAEGLFAAIQATIREPLLILEMQQGEVDYEVDYWFYRKTDDQNSLLVGTKKTSDHYTTTACHKNPTPTQMSLLYKKAAHIR